VRRDVAAAACQVAGLVIAFAQYDRSTAVREVVGGVMKIFSEVMKRYSFIKEKIL
jgi:hypothetical protein